MNHLNVKEKSLVRGLEFLYPRAKNGSFLEKQLSDTLSLLKNQNSPLGRGDTRNEIADVRHPLGVCLRWMFLDLRFF